MPAPGMHSGSPSDEALNLAMSEKGQPLYEAVVRFIAEEVDPMTPEFFRLGEGRADRWGYGDGQLELLDAVKAKAKDQGLWNFFLPDAETGEGLSNLDYAYIAAEMGKNPLASECLNCSAPDTGNMEVLERVGSPEQKKQWLEPLLNGEIRSAFAMTEPDVASSDAKNIETRAVRDGDEWVIDGEKYYISGAGDPRCKIMIVMVLTSPDGPSYRRHSQILVPMDTPGVEILGPMTVFGSDDAPHGHMHLRFTGVRVPAENMLLGEGRGFEISQVRLGPGRIHHCMRSIGAAERALELMIRRGLNREAFNKPLARLGKNTEVIAKARIEIEAMRLMVLRAARAMDTMGNTEARVWVSAVKAMVPERVCQIIDEAIQIHGATGISQWTPLAAMYAGQRTLRLADGPDEVHWHVVGRAEVARYADDSAPAPPHGHDRRRWRLLRPLLTRAGTRSPDLEPPSLAREVPAGSWLGSSGASSGDRKGAELAEPPCPRRGGEAVPTSEDGGVSRSPSSLAKVGFPSPAKTSGQLMKTGTPRGRSRATSWRTVSLVRRTQPCETRWPISFGWLVPWMPTCPGPPLNSVWVSECRARPKA